MSNPNFVNPDWPSENAVGSPASNWLPDAILSTSYVRETARQGLALPIEKRAAFWKRRRSFATRRLYVAGIDEVDIVRYLRAFHRRVEAEVVVRNLINRVESACASDDAEALADGREDEDEAGTRAGTNS